MIHILEKIEAQNKKMRRIKERAINKPCLICRDPISRHGFSSIHGICKKCESESVYGVEYNGSK